MPPNPRTYAVLPLAWALIIVVLTLTPAADMPPTPEWELLAFDTAAHAGVFGLLALLSWFSLRRQHRWPRLARHPGWPILLGSFLFGGLIELLQTTMHMGRQGDVKDLIGDTIGAALALGLAWLLRHRIPAVASLLLFAATVAGSYRADAQDLTRARQTIETLASPKMHGRGYVRQGEHIAAAYLRGKLKALKLEPLAPNYTQPFMLDVNTFPGRVELRIRRNAGVNERPTLGGMPFPKLEVGSDFIVAANSAPYQKARPYVQPLDTLIFTDTTAAVHYLDSYDKKCRFCPQNLLLIRAKDERRLKMLPRATQQRIEEHGWVVLVPKLTASVASSQEMVPHLEALAEKWPVSTTGQEVELMLDAKLQRNYPTQNLAAVIRGTAQPDSFLVISAHYDHLGMMGKDVYFPGANDNASGVALLLELAAHYARPENRPACSVVFLLFGAEEAGLVGSQYFVAHPLVPLARIKFLVNLDLLGTGEQGATVVNGKVFEAPYQRLVALNEAHHYLPALGARGKAANSDHYPFSEAGVPAFFIYTRGGSPAYHDVNDTPAALSLAGFAGAFGLVRDFLNEQRAAPTPKK